jgi:septum formation protein
MGLPHILLASRSPRRRELLLSMGLSVKVLDSDPHAETLEAALEGENPVSYVARVAMLKLQHALNSLSMRPDMTRDPSAAVVLSADTTVAIDGKILGKPGNAREASAMLRLLSNRIHQVHTAVCARRVDTGPEQSVTVSSEVVFANLPEPWIERYVASGEPMDKAGAYGIQGAAGSMIPRINGSYSGIMGLPLFETMQLIEHLGKDSTTAC